MDSDSYFAGRILHLRMCSSVGVMATAAQPSDGCTRRCSKRRLMPVAQSRGDIRQYKRPAPVVKVLQVPVLVVSNMPMKIPCTATHKELYEV